MPDKLEQLKHEHEVRQEGEEEALHVRNAVPIIELAIVAPVVCLVAAVLVALFR